MKTAKVIQKIHHYAENNVEIVERWNKGKIFFPRLKTFNAHICGSWKLCSFDCFLLTNCFYWQIALFKQREQKMWQIIKITNKSVRIARSSTWHEPLARRDTHRDTRRQTSPQLGGHYWKGLLMCLHQPSFKKNNSRSIKEVNLSALRGQPLRERY